MLEESKIQKVYLAILNNGPLRREMTTIVIPAMQKTKGVNVIWENPNKTWANPISSNRNKIVKRFLDTDCDYLLMIDDDVVPLHNPCEMVYVNRDVVASPALVRCEGGVMAWTAYVPHSDGVGYSAIDLNSFDDMLDVLEVAIVGTGCILVKRKVLETLKAPFHSEFDEDGIQTYGTDFAFSRKATKGGFKIYTMVHHRCEHFKRVGFSNIDAWDSVNYFDSSNKEYKIPWGADNITQKDWAFIKRYIEEVKPKRILEFGLGLSSLLMSEICEVISYATNSKHKVEIEAKCTDKNNLTIKLWDGRNFSNSDYISTHEEFNLLDGPKENEKFDFVFVGGPEEKSKGGIGRDAAIKIAAQVSDHIIIHDAGQMEEELYQRKYLRSIFKLVRKSGNHIARCHYWIRRPKSVTLEEVMAQMKVKKG